MCQIPVAAAVGKAAVEVEVETTEAVAGLEGAVKEEGVTEVTGEEAPERVAVAGSAVEVEVLLEVATVVWKAADQTAVRAVAGGRMTTWWAAR
jgi:hypothetical protein